MFNDFDILASQQNLQNSQKSQKSQASSKNLDKVSYSGHLQKQVINCWKKACLSSDYETCCHWTMEMVLSKWQDVLWESILLFSAKHIHSQNPKIGLFLKKIKVDYPNLNIPNCKHDTLEIFTFIIGVLIYSPKGIVYPTPSIKSTEDEIDHVISTLTKCTLSNHVRSVMVSGDSIVLAGLLNACTQHLTTCDLNNSLRIIGWIIQLEKNKKYKEHIVSGSRYDNSSWVFFLWDTLVVYAEQNKVEYHDIIKSWREFYCDGYTKPMRTSRFPMVINALILLSQKVYRDLPCIHNQSMIQKACRNVEHILTDIIKKKEEKHSYLF